MGFPVEMFTVLFAIGRTPGWLATGTRCRQNSRIARPRQRYTGPMSATMSRSTLADPPSAHHEPATSMTIVPALAFSPMRIWASAMSSIE